jgi:Family of unknown function (DUF6210)
MDAHHTVYIDFNARDESPFVLGMIVSAPTGVVYANQCGGLHTLWKEMEGYLVVLGGARAAEPFISFFDKRFDGNPPVDADGWTAWDLESIDELILANVRYFATTAGGESDEEIPVVLDRELVDELTEAWIPVRVGDGMGALVFANSD